MQQTIVSTPVQIIPGCEPDSKNMWDINTGTVLAPRMLLMEHMTIKINHGYYANTKLLFGFMKSLDYNGAMNM